MAIGHKSPYIYLKIWNGVKFVFVLVQASRKTLGICDVVETVRVKNETIDPKTKKKRINYENQPVRRLCDVLSKFQGQQYNSSRVVDNLTEYLEAYLNSIPE